MSLTLRQTATSSSRIDMRGLLPERLNVMDDAEIRCLPMYLGNRQVPLSELFDVENAGERDDTLVFIPQGNELDYLGAELRQGRIIVRGDAGNYAGRAMLGGSLSIEGSAGDFAGSGMGGGTLSISGSAGDRVGAPSAGERHGQHGGLIHINGNAGARAGERQRRGVLIINGNAGVLLGHRMIAGTLYVGGHVAEMAGYGMRRGTVLLRHAPRQICETMAFNGKHSSSFLRLLLKELKQISGGTMDGLDESSAVRYLGDLACDGLGEILVLE